MKLIGYDFIEIGYGKADRAVQRHVSGAIQDWVNEYRLPIQSQINRRIRRLLIIEMIASEVI